jgi:hypothetical protein
MEGKARIKILVLSVLLHFLVLVCWDNFITLNIFQKVPATTPAAAKSMPLVFDLEQPAQQALPHEVIATPANAKTTNQPKKADFLSDKNALARNQEPAPGVRLGNDPYSRGDFASHDLPPQPASPGKEPAATAQAKEKPAEKETSTNKQPKQKPAELDKNPLEANQEMLAEETTGLSRPQNTESSSISKIPFRLPIPGVQHDHRDSQVPDSGGLSFNTYNWDFAPYMLELKEHIYRNIFPPLAFSKLGMIDGDTLLRFKIYPNGELRDLELLSYQGHRSLMETSTFAIKISAPFRKLPADFPEPYLEVTAKFSYIITNKRG